jgi:hypothetical protein
LKKAYVVIQKWRIAMHNSIQNYLSNEVARKILLKKSGIKKQKRKITLTDLRKLLGKEGGAHA